MDTTYDKIIKDKENILRKSKTAYSAGTIPTSSDISANEALKNAESMRDRLENDRLKEQWYSSEENTYSDPKKERGYFGNLLHVMGLPTYAIAGGVEAVLGKGTKKGISNIAANIEEEGTFGDILRSYDVPNSVAMPLGLLLDIGLDPINWATMGTAALAPRTLYGAYKGAKTGAGIVKGAKSALSSGLLTKAEKIGKLVPGLTRKMKNIAKEGSTLKAGAVINKFKNIQKAGETSRTAYGKLTGDTLSNMLSKNYNKVNIGDKFENYLTKRKFGDELIEGFKYGPGTWWDKQDEVIAMAGNTDELSRLNTAAGFDPIDDLINEGRNVGNKAVNGIRDDMKEGVKAMASGKAGRSRNSLENSLRLKEEAIKSADFKAWIDDLSKDAHGVIDEAKAADIQGIYDTFKTGFEPYDKKIAKLIATKTGRKSLNSYGVYLGLFKTAKIGGNLATAGMNAVVGNLVMTYMAGVNTLNPSYMSSIKKAIKIIKTKDITAMSGLLEGKSLMQAATDMPEIFRMSFGIDPKLITKGINYVDDIAEKAALAGKQFSAKDVASLKKGIAEGIKDANDYSRKALKTAKSTVETALSGNQTAMITGEIMGKSSSPFGSFMNKAKKAGEEGNALYDFFYKTASGLTEAYGKVDQTYRLGLTLHLVENGITEKEMRLLSKVVKINPATDIIKGVGDSLKLTPSTAMKASLEVYMNYLAMPGFVKGMRSLPIFGFPFIAFAYAMTAKTGKTMLHNPAIFNKIQFLLKEIGGDKSPLEKSALSSKYYSYYNKPGMMKIPFFKDNPVYLNMENMLPYYTLSVFQPSERSYSSKAGKALSGALQKSPFLKTPEGQLLVDYFILPMLIKEQAKGAFNQQLWSKDAKFPEKAARFATGAVETIMPPMAGYAGLLTPYNVAKYMPLGYRFRQLSGAKEGKSALGISNQESAAQKTIRTLGSMSGLPTYQMNLDFGKKR